MKMSLEPEYEVHAPAIALVQSKMCMMRKVLIVFEEYHFKYFAKMFSTHISIYNIVSYVPDIWHWRVCTNYLGKKD